MRSFAPALFLALTLSLSAEAGPPIDYQHEYQAGSDSYAAGNYRAAEIHYLSALKGQPTSWRIYYQLGNCFLQLKDASDAKNSYESCLKLQPPADIRKNCQQVLGSMARAIEPASPETQTGAPGSPAASEGSKATPAPSGEASKSDQDKPPEKEDWDTERKRLVEEHRTHIMDEARKEAEKIRDEAKKALEEMKQTSGRYYKYDDGSLKLDVPAETSAAITGEAEKRAQAILDEARRRAAAVNTP
jgi:tetratricopeptide (TPR) repeat protein